MNKIVRHHYPVSKLPPELREGIPLDRSVTVTIVEDESYRGTMSLDEIFRARTAPYRSVEEIDFAIRNLRNELNG